MRPAATHNRAARRNAVLRGDVNHESYHARITQMQAALNHKTTLAGHTLGSSAQRKQLLGQW